MIKKRKRRKRPLRFGLYGESDILPPEFIHCEKMVFRNPKHNSIIVPHVHTNLCQIFFIYAGNVYFTFDKEKKDVKANSIVTIPENTLHGMKCDDDIDGVVLTFSSSFAENVMTRNQASVKHLNGVSVLEISNLITLERLKGIVGGLQEELNQESSMRQVVQSYLNLLLNKIHQLSTEAQEEFSSHDHRTLTLYKEFIKNIKKNYTPMKSITDYASELGISSGHLHRICTATVNKAPLQIVHDYLLIEAKKYLTHSNYSIAEISYRLHFADPAYFSRFFKKMESVSPKSFRYQK